VSVSPTGGGAYFGGAGFGYAEGRELSTIRKVDRDTVIGV